MNDVAFRGRIKVAALQIATYYLEEDPNTPAHNSRYKWGQSAYQSPDIVAQQLHPAVVMDGAVQASGAEIPDAQLKSSVEAVISKLI